MCFAVRDIRKTQNTILYENTLARALSEVFIAMF